jgi:hypothetical protein
MNGYHKTKRGTARFELKDKRLALGTEVPRKLK